MKPRPVRGFYRFWTTAPPKTIQDKRCQKTSVFWLSSYWRRYSSSFGGGSIGITDPIHRWTRSVRDLL